MLEQPAREGETHQTLVEAKRALVEDGKLLAKVYNEPAVFELEKDNIFTKTWMFLAHESEIPDPGDYVVRRIVGDSFIVSRDERGGIHVLFNMCRHLGMQLCRADAGNASHFRCPYHGWTYRNTGKLNGPPFQKEAYGKDGLDKEEWAMTPAPGVGVHKGMIFASMTPDVPRWRTLSGGWTGIWTSTSTRRRPAPRSSVLPKGGYWTRTGSSPPRTSSAMATTPSPRTCPP